MGASQVSCLYLLGFFLLFAGVFSKPSLIQSQEVIFAKPNFVHSEEVGQERASVENLSSIYLKNYEVTIWKEAGFTGFTGFRSVFQWTVGKTVNNYGIHNAMKYTANDTVNRQIVGNIGLYSNGTQVGVQFSLDTVANPNPTFNCSKAFPFDNKTRSCFNPNYSLKSNAIYFLDVEIRNRTIAGYISQPQTNLSAISNSTLPRTLIGEINWSSNLTSLYPASYWIAKPYKSCKVSSEITTYNYIPEMYNKDKRQKAIFSGSVLWDYRICGPLNTLALTDWNAVVYISRPDPVVK